MASKNYTHRKTLGLTALAACVLAMSSTQPADAALKLYEGFNTTTNAELGGQGSGSGWGANNWSTTEATEGTNFFKTLGGAASFSASDYGALDINFRSIQRGGRGGKAEANRLWNTNTVRSTGNEVWFSVLTKYFTSGGNAALAMTSNNFDPTQSTVKLVDSVNTDLGLGLGLRLRFAANSEIRLSSWKDGVVSSSSAVGLPAAHQRQLVAHPRPGRLLARPKKQAPDYRHTRRRLSTLPPPRHRPARLFTCRPADRWLRRRGH